MTKDEALKALIHEMEYVLSCINERKIPFDGDDFHEALRLGKKALAQPEPWEKFCDLNCIWTDHHPDCKLAQPEQEPVAWTLLLVGEHHGIIGKAGETFATSPEHYRRVDVYTTPPQRKPLTDEQIDEEFKLYASKFDTSSDKWLDMGADDYFKAGFKAAHGIKENKHDKR